MLTYLAASWLAIALATGVVAIISTVAGILALLFFLAATVAIGQQVWLLLQARQKVLVHKDVPLLWGLVRLVAWDPIEGVLFLRNKRLDFRDDDLHDGHGGVRFIYPVLGDELALRVPLEVQTLRFADENVLTREYLSVTAKGTLKWRIHNIEQFYLLVSRELRTTWEHKDHTHQSRSMQTPALRTAGEATSNVNLLNLVIEWLRAMTEEQTRFVMSRMSSGLLLADRLSNELSEVKEAARHDLALPTSDAASGEWAKAADNVAAKVFDTMRARTEHYGIEVVEVSLQEIRLPEEIVQQCIEACKAAYLPLLAHRKASAKRADYAAETGRLAHEVELLGREAVGTREIIGEAPAVSLVDFLGSFLSKRLADPAGVGLGASATGALVGGALASQAGGATPSK